MTGPRVSVAAPARPGPSAPARIWGGPLLSAAVLRRAGLVLLCVLLAAACLLTLITLLNTDTSYALFPVGQGQGKGIQSLSMPLMPTYGRLVAALLFMALCLHVSTARTYGRPILAASLIGFGLIGAVLFGGVPTLAVALAKLALMVLCTPLVIGMLQERGAK